MKSFISICLIIVLSLFTTNCTIRQFVPERKDLGTIYEGENLVPNGDMEILDNGQPVRWMRRKPFGDVVKLFK